MEIYNHEVARSATASKRTVGQADAMKSTRTLQTALILVDFYIFFLKRLRYHTELSRNTSCARSYERVSSIRHYISPVRLHCTVVQSSHESRRKYWATRSSVRLFARTAHSFACSGLFASLALSAALTRLLVRSLRSLPRSLDSDLLYG